MMSHRPDGCGGGGQCCTAPLAPLEGRCVLGTFGRSVTSPGKIGVKCYLMCGIRYLFVFYCSHHPVYLFHRHQEGVAKKYLIISRP